MARVSESQEFLGSAKPCPQPPTSGLPRGEESASGGNPGRAEAKPRLADVYVYYYYYVYNICIKDIYVYNITYYYWGLRRAGGGAGRDQEGGAQRARSRAHLPERLVLWPRIAQRELRALSAAPDCGLLLAVGFCCLSFELRAPAKPGGLPILGGRN